MESGVPSVITLGTAVMLAWSVGSWDSLCWVRMTKIYSRSFEYYVLAWWHFTGGIPFINAHFGSGTGPALIDFVSCTGNEQFLANCTNRGIGITSSWCGHDDDAGVQCPGNSENHWDVDVTPCSVMCIIAR